MKLNNYLLVCSDVLRNEIKTKLSALEKQFKLNNCQLIGNKTMLNFFFACSEEDLENFARWAERFPSQGNFFRSLTSLDTCKEKGEANAFDFYTVIIDLANGMRIVLMPRKPMCYIGNDSMEGEFSFIACQVRSFLQISFSSELGSWQFFSKVPITNIFGQY